VSRQPEESIPQSASMRLVETDDTSKDKTECYARWPPARPGMNGTCCASPLAVCTGHSQP
jgi:hypothetical protein